MLLFLHEYYSKEKFNEARTILDPIFHRAGRIRTDVNYLKYAQKLEVDNARPVKALQNKIDGNSEKFQSEIQQFFHSLAKCPPMIIKKIHPLKNNIAADLDQHYFKRINKHLHQIDQPAKFHK